MKKRLLSNIEGIMTLFAKKNVTLFGCLFIIYQPEVPKVLMK